MPVFLALWWKHLSSSWTSKLRFHLRQSRLRFASSSSSSQSSLIRRPMQMESGTESVCYVLRKLLQCSFLRNMRISGRCYSHTASFADFSCARSPSTSEKAAWTSAKINGCKGCEAICRTGFCSCSCSKKISLYKSVTGPHWVIFGNWYDASHFVCTTSASGRFFYSFCTAFSSSALFRGSRLFVVIWPSPSSGGSEESSGSSSALKSPSRQAVVLSTALTPLRESESPSSTAHSFQQHKPPSLIRDLCRRRQQCL